MQETDDRAAREAHEERRLWKHELAQEVGHEVHVSNLPPGTSKWIRIEHGFFRYVTRNWGRPAAYRR